MMTSFCNKRVLSFFLSLPNSKHNGTVLDFPLPRQDIFAAASIGGDTQKPTNHLEPTTMILPATTTAAAEKKDPGGIGFLDEVGGRVDGLMSCTETLGFESSYERSVDDQIEDHHDIDLVSRKSYCTNTNMAASTNNSRFWQKTNLEKKNKKKFPPPLSSLSQDGKPNFFLRAVRKDGRLKLTEVKISRPETLLASRQDGRLRLHLIHNLEEEAEEENDDFRSETEEHLDDEEVMETIDESDEEINEEEEEVGEWKFPMTSCGSGDGHRRYYGGHHGHGQNHHHHHDLHVWRQRCVTTR